MKNTEFDCKSCINHQDDVIHTPETRDDVMKNLIALACTPFDSQNTSLVIATFQKMHDIIQKEYNRDIIGFFQASGEQKICASLLFNLIYNRELNNLLLELNEDLVYFLRNYIELTIQETREKSILGKILS